MTSDVRVFDDLEGLSRAAARATVDAIGAAVRAAGRCSLALAGGETPRTLHALLAADCRDMIPWTEVHVFWGDERYVPPDDPASNYRMARETLLDHVPCPSANIHPMPTHLPSPDAAAREYEGTLREHFGSGWPRFDLVFLGLGEDGHTASLFPESPALVERRRWVVPVEVQAAPPVRLTLTLPVLLEAARIFVLVSGANKAAALRRALAADSDPNACPAAALRDADGELIWWVDRAAGARLASAERKEKAAH